MEAAGWDSVWAWPQARAESGLALSFLLAIWRGVLPPVLASQTPRTKSHTFRRTWNGQDINAKSNQGS
eukprot:scaffold145814_cov24-Tisochrysis_lutea.AAC.1